MDPGTSHRGVRPSLAQPLVLLDRVWHKCKPAPCTAVVARHCSATARPRSKQARRIARIGWQLIRDADSCAGSFFPCRSRTAAARCSYGNPRATAFYRLPLPSSVQPIGAAAFSRAPARPPWLSASSLTGSAGGSPKTLDLRREASPTQVRTAGSPGRRLPASAGPAGSAEAAIAVKPQI